MASVRAFRPLLRPAPQIAARATQQQARFLSWESSPPFYTAHASVTGGRKGKISAENLNIQLAAPKELGGPGNGSNPEELFAAGYGACFQGAMAVTAPSINIKLPEDSVIDTKVHLIGDAKKLDMGIRVDMKIKFGSGISKADAEKVVEKTKEVCPYSRATAGNVITNTEVVVG
ncbi:Organic hydroperoxide resistance protein [Pseudocercospora fuligena]|uniref:Organic hydroperoxide resistance protein n=1 Tax=Pseudocercospora fuligena TaxID=685502 RepID=A0A8H6RLE1_9PEZI|nr:Organic hydroperoxide resistance protein [Pseudocercospora fuligena]